ncbi:MAG: c-type cytochrome [Usitatibacteraceae bacterium]
MHTFFERQTIFLSRRFFACLSLCAWLPLIATAGGPPHGGDSTATPAALYHSYCSVCHGEQGNGQSRARASLNPPPVDFTQPGLRATLTRERMTLGVREGRPGTAMVGWKTQLTDRQIAALVDYVREKFMAPDTTGKNATATLVKPAPAATLSPIRPGDKVSGAALYENNCVACHGKGGDGNGPRAYFISPKPRSFITADSRAVFTRPVLINSIGQGKRGTEMPAWNKVLSDQEIANIAEYVFQRFITAESTVGASARK